jgi:hypothetical protein
MPVYGTTRNRREGDYRAVIVGESGQYATSPVWPAPEARAKAYLRVREPIFHSTAGAPQPVGNPP